ncbi:MAG: response regulator transcription factor [Actinomycetota bacterium]|nr:response regulator transcription factor [Actinomycetota bacterium]
MAAVLVVDDDETVREVVVAYLRQAGHDITEAADGPGAMDAARSRPDIVVLDVMLPGFDGLEVCRRLRSEQPGVPIVMLSALGEEEDRIAGLGEGADDYLCKPFSPRELVLRVASLLRRAQSPTSGPAAPLVDGDLAIDPIPRSATRGERPLSLTAREFDLLAFLLSNPGQAYSREDLLSRVWGWEFGDLTTVTVHVRRLREKVEVDPSSPTRLVTVWGVGYRWDPAP